ncbi:uncharacterized protein LOC134540125 [Bacillus rossius redtenbacheri]|uniref:uncharacterized protein LOC134540125 n=1 Tax=Bacillus rossius redtenbacheri TaxID=93214 RepID=UPI002FDCC5EC
MNSCPLPRPTSAAPRESQDVDMRATSVVGARVSEVFGPHPSADEGMTHISDVLISVDLEMKDISGLLLPCMDMEMRELPQCRMIPQGGHQTRRRLLGVAGRCAASCWPPDWVARRRTASNCPHEDSLVPSCAYGCRTRKPGGEASVLLPGQPVALPSDT